MVEKFIWTIDVESDFGGRSESAEKSKIGIHKILEAFKIHHIKGLFFISTEILPQIKNEVRQIKEEGHEIGSHGHFHIGFPERWRAEQDRKISETFLLGITGYNHFYYRAPKFSHLRDNCVYSKPTNHIGLLRYMWFGGKITDETIFYLHPFDIIGGDDAPNLFCKLWYSRPKKAYETFVNLLKHYH